MKCDAVDRQFLFISHANPERNAFTLWLGLRFSAAGYHIWADVFRLPGWQDLQWLLEGTLTNKARKVLPAGTRRSAQNQGVRNEIRIAHDIGRRIGDLEFVFPLPLAWSVISLYPYSPTIATQRQNTQHGNYHRPVKEQIHSRFREKCLMMVAVRTTCDLSTTLGVFLNYHRHVRFHGFCIVVFQMTNGNPTYQPNPAHRNNTPGKSQWAVSLPDEQAIFLQSVNEQWLSAECGWGLHLVEGAPSYLGVAQDHLTEVFFAKFVGKSTSPWHGYPADHVRNSQDVPHEEVLSAWMQRHLISRAKVRKILRGKRCHL